MTNVIIKWHNVLGRQQIIQNVVGKRCRLLPSNEKVILKLAWADFPHKKPNAKETEFDI